jgi:DNA-binding NarL/FixJ family response regulator
MTEDQIRTALDGHYYVMHTTAKGQKVIDLGRGEEAVSEDEDDAPIPTQARITTYVKPNSIDWPEKDATILSMRRAGKTYKQIGDAVGVCKDSVRWRYQRLCEDMGLDPGEVQSTAKKYDPAFIAEIVRLRDSGLSFKQIGQRLGVSKPFVCVTYNRWYRANAREAA